MREITVCTYVRLVPTEFTLLAGHWRTAGLEMHPGDNAQIKDKI